MSEAAPSAGTVIEGSFKVFLYDKEDPVVYKSDFPYLAKGGDSVSRAAKVVSDFQRTRMQLNDLKALIKDAYASSVCGEKGNITQTFFADTLKDCTKYVVIANDVVVPKRATRSAVSHAELYDIKTVARSFLLASREPIKDTERSAFYVDLICGAPRHGGKHPSEEDSRYAGRNVMYVATEYALRKGYDEMALSSVAEKLSLYARWGFQGRPSCGSDAHYVPIPAELLMKPFFTEDDYYKEAAKFVSSKASAQRAKEALVYLEDTKTERHSASEKGRRASQKVAAIRALESHAIYLEENKPFLDYMLDLRAAGLEASHGYDTLERQEACRYKGGGERERGERLNELKMHHCEQDGYKMRQCNIGASRTARSGVVGGAGAGTGTGAIRK